MIRPSLFMASLLASCSSTIELEENAPAHHRQDGTFVNSNGEAMTKPFSDLIKWQREAPDVTPINLPSVPPQLDTLANPSAAQLTWIGHSTFLLQFDGLNILTDPIFSERASPVSFAGPKRTTPPAMTVEQLPPIDVVLISHNHYDHLDKPSVKALQAKQSDTPPRYYVPLGQKAWFDKLGITKVTELDWWTSAKVGDATVHAVPVQHWSSRSPFDRNKALWAGFVIDSPSLRTLFVGDSGYSDDFKAIAQRLGKVDLALVPIGAYDPRWFMKSSHMNPEEALLVVQDVGAKRAIGMHWGTFALTDEPMAEPGERAAATGVIETPKPGQTIDLSGI
ncbi:MAG: N-acyl-phosphatidylethanolamine-hydrolyzing phospholipase D [Granulosicoccus sp.]|jgi:N-acyl-phosphatidylethanolamine-hydrolysing phospholipase D